MITLKERVDLDKKLKNGAVRNIIYLAFDCVQVMWKICIWSHTKNIRKKICSTTETLKIKHNGL